MTRDTPGDADTEFRWCPTCQISVEPSDGESGPECPSCGTEL